MEPRIFHPPTAKQARLIWMGVTAFCIGLFLAVLALVLWAMGWALQRLTPVLLPLAIAGAFYRVATRGSCFSYQKSVDS